jgi:tetratricopeptide (TPR) repeat protein
MRSFTNLICLIIVVVSMALPAQLVCQQNPIDSLLNALKTTGEDTNRVNTFNNLAWEIIFTTGEYDKTMSYANDAIDLSKKINYKKGNAEALNVIGAAYMFQGNYNEALEYYFESLKIREVMEDKKGIAAAYSNIGLVYMYQGDYSKALKNHQASLKIEKERGDKAGIAGSYNNIGIVYEDLGNYPEALKNHLASLKIDEELGNKSGIANSYNNIGSIYEIQRNFKEALKNHYAALKIRQELGDQRGIADSYLSIGNCNKELGNFTEALKNFLESLDIANAIGNKPGVGNAYNNIGNVYMVQGDSAYAKGNENFAINDRYPLAIENYKISLKIREEIGDRAGVASNYNNLGAVNLKLKKYGPALIYLNDALDVSKEIGNKKIIRDTYNHLSVLDSAQGNFAKAYEHYKLFITYRDSLFNEEKIQQTAQMHMNYEIEKDQLLEAQALEKEKARIARRNMLQYMLIFVIVFLVVGAVLLLGSIKFPPALAQGLNFVSLLLVFESILVFTDPYLDTFTNGVPIYKLLVNILLAVLIFPIHNFMDRRFRKRLKLN